MRKLLQRTMLDTFSAPSGVVTGVAVYTTQFQPIDSFESCMIQLAWTGSPTATVSLEISADAVPPLGYSSGSSLPQPVVFDTLSGSAQSTTGTNVITYEVLHTDAQWIRVKWTNASGAGVVTSIRLVAKGSMV